MNKPAVSMDADNDFETTASDEGRQFHARAGASASQA
jgi:hypothetical protein